MVKLIILGHRHNNWQSSYVNYDVTIHSNSDWITIYYDILVYITKHCYIITPGNGFQTIHNDEAYVSFASTIVFVHTDIHRLCSDFKQGYVRYFLSGLHSGRIGPLYVNHFKTHSNHSSIIIDSFIHFWVVRSCSDGLVLRSFGNMQSILTSKCFIWGLHRLPVTSPRSKDCNVPVTSASQPVTSSIDLQIVQLK